MPSKVAFEDRIKQLLAFEANHGHLIVPQTNGNLGGWCRSVRRGLCKISDEEKAKLDEIGFLFDVPKGAAKEEMIQWCKHFKMLVAFKKAKDHCNVPAIVAGKPYPLATWCDEQRQLYGEGKLDQGKIDKLNRLGFDFFGSSTPDDDAEPASKRQKFAEKDDGGNDTPNKDDKDSKIVDLIKEIEDLKKFKAYATTELEKLNKIVTEAALA